MLSLTSNSRIDTARSFDSLDGHPMFSVDTLFKKLAIGAGKLLSKTSLNTVVDMIGIHL